MADSELERRRTGQSTQPFAVISLSSPIPAVLRNCSSPPHMTKPLNGSEQTVSDSTAVTPPLVNKKDVIPAHVRRIAIVGQVRSVATQTTFSSTPVEPVFTTRRHFNYEYSPMLMLHQHAVAPDHSETRGPPKFVPKGQNSSGSRRTPPLAPFGHQTEDSVHPLADSTLSILRSSTCEQFQQPFQECEGTEPAMRSRLLTGNNPTNVEAAGSSIVQLVALGSSKKPDNKQTVGGDNIEQVISTHILYPCKVDYSIVATEAHDDKLISTQGLFQEQSPPLPENQDTKNDIHGCYIVATDGKNGFSSKFDDNCLTNCDNHSVAHEEFDDDTTIDTLAIASDPLNPLPPIEGNRESPSSDKVTCGKPLPAAGTDMEDLQHDDLTSTVSVPQHPPKNRHPSPLASGSNNISYHPNKSAKTSSSALKRRRSVVSINSSDDTSDDLLLKKVFVSPNKPVDQIELDDATLAHRLWAYLSKQEATLDDGRRLWLNKYNILKQHEDDLQTRQKSLNDRVQSLEKATARLHRTEAGIQQKEVVIRQREKKLNELSAQIEDTRKQFQLRKQNMSDWMRSEEIIWQKAFGKGEDKHRNINQDLSGLMNSIIGVDFYSHAHKPNEPGFTQGLKNSPSNPLQGPPPQISKTGKQKFGKFMDILAKQDLGELTSEQMDVLDEETDYGSEVLLAEAEDNGEASTSKGKGKEMEGES